MPHWIWIAVICSVTGVALWKGGPSERRGAIYYFVAWLATRAFRNDDDRFGTQYATFAIDLTLLALLVHLALRSRRYWPMAMAAFHLLAVLTHVGRVLDQGLSAWAYYTAAQIWGYLILTSVAVGTYNHWRMTRDLIARGEAIADFEADLR